MRIRNDITKKKSGSAASKPIKWKWYEHMKSLHDKQDSHKLVYSNIVYEETDILLKISLNIIYWQFFCFSFLILIFINCSL